jgi:tryptophan-rich sensory protein
MVVWTILYILVGAAIGYQAFLAVTPAHWCSLALLAGAVVVAWAWPTVWSAALDRRLPAGAPVWVIAAMLVASGTGLCLVPNSTSAALWAPFALWLVVALVLAVQAQTLRREGTTGGGALPPTLQ